MPWAVACKRRTHPVEVMPCCYVRNDIESFLRYGMFIISSCDFLGLAWDGVRARVVEIQTVESGSESPPPLMDSR